MKSVGAHVSTSCYLNPNLLYTLQTLLRFHMILMHERERRKKREREGKREREKKMREREREKERERE